MEHPIESLMKTTLESLKEMIDVNTIVGSPVTSSDGSTIIPISKVTIGFASGGSEFSSDKCQTADMPFGGGSGAGISVQPVAFLIVNKDMVKLLPIDQQGSMERIIDNIPGLMNQIKDMFSSSDKNCDTLDKDF